MKINKKILASVCLFLLSGVCAFFSDKIGEGNFKDFITAMSVFSFFGGIIILLDI